MAIETEINSINVLFVNFTTGIDLQYLKEQETETIVFLKGTPSLLETQELLNLGMKVDVRDSLGDLVTNITREESSCLDLVKWGEFLGENIFIVSNACPVGLITAMKGCGVEYPKMDNDSIIFEGSPKFHTRECLSEYGYLLMVGMHLLRKEDSENDQKIFFEDFVSFIQGDELKKEILKETAIVFEKIVSDTICLASTAKQIVEGIWCLDVRGKKYDQGTLERKIGNKHGYLFMITIKDFGPIAKIHGIQYSLTAALHLNGVIDLTKLLTIDEGERTAENGIIFHNSLLLECNQQWLDEQVLPALKNLSA